MMRQLLVLVFGLICSSCAAAEKVKGYYVSTTNDTVQVTFIIPTEIYTMELVLEKLQWKIVYFDADEKKKKLTPDLATEIGFEYDSVKVRMLSRQNNLEDVIGTLFADNENVFLHLIKDGKLKLFKY